MRRTKRPTDLKADRGGTCWRTKRVYALQQEIIEQVLATRDYSYSGTSCTPADHLDTWYKYNDVGNVIATLDYNGNITSRIDMESFGTVHKGGGYNTPRLTTKEYDMESGLYYFGARWYDKEQGRWIQQEPAGFDGPNWYHFNFNNSTSRIDYDGLSSQKLAGDAAEQIYGPLLPHVPKMDCSCRSGKFRCECEFDNCMLNAYNIANICMSGCAAKCAAFPIGARQVCLRACIVTCGIPVVGVDVHCLSAYAGCLSGLQ